MTNLTLHQLIEWREKPFGYRCVDIEPEEPWIEFVEGPEADPSENGWPYPEVVEDDEK